MRPTGAGAPPPVRDGKVVRGREYLSVEDALRAAGLEE